MAAEYNRKDEFYQKAKKEGYRSRAAYKLLELDKKFKFLKPGQRVLDLGCAPGSWSQVALRRVGAKGKVIGVDLEAVEEVSCGDNVATLLQADITEQDTIENVIRLADGKLDILISDLSHKLTGIRLSDEARSTELLEMAFQCAEKLLKTNGVFVAKLFPSNDTDVLVKSIRPCFTSFSREVLKSTRKSSKEFYLVGRGFKGPRS